ncbi:chromatin-remodeling ATPase INO80-like [Panicum virgatum]|uniref:chromatin-remodeling ATPase INO80-like n=1 Tax=Panicum virgatum TaxID=38727 RepID=UPI0019D5DCD3|nr:chromatin-remodeling ATPase INO80-like [Panicum virgatum]
MAGGISDGLDLWREKRTKAGGREGKGTRGNRERRRRRKTSARAGRKNAKPPSSDSRANKITRDPPPPPPPPALAFSTYFVLALPPSAASSVAFFLTPSAAYRSPTALAVVFSARHVRVDLGGRAAIQGQAHYSPAPDRSRNLHAWREYKATSATRIPTHNHPSPAAAALLSTRSVPRPPAGLRPRRLPDALRQLHLTQLGLPRLCSSESRTTLPPTTTMAIRRPARLTIQFNSGCCCLCNCLVITTLVPSSIRPRWKLQILPSNTTAQGLRFLPKSSPSSAVIPPPIDGRILDP